MPTDGDLKDKGRLQYDDTDKAYEPVGDIICKALTEDEDAKNEDTTISSATGLTTPIAQGTVRVVTFDLIVSGATAADFDVAVAVPDNATADVVVDGLAAAATAESGDIVRSHAAHETELTVGTAGVGTETYVRVVATVVAGANDSGDVELQWAQGTSTASDTVLHGGSAVTSVLANG